MSLDPTVQAPPKPEKRPKETLLSTTVRRAEVADNEDLLVHLISSMDMMVHVPPGPEYKPKESLMNTATTIIGGVE